MQQCWAVQEKVLLMGSLCNEGLAPGTPFWGTQQLAGSPVLFQVSFCPLA